VLSPGRKKINENENEKFEIGQKGIRGICHLGRDPKSILACWYQIIFRRRGFSLILALSVRVVPVPSFRYGNEASSGG